MYDYLQPAQVTCLCMPERCYFFLTEMGDRVFNLEIKESKHRD